MRGEEGSPCCQAPVAIAPCIAALSDRSYRAGTPCEPAQPMSLDGTIIQSEMSDSTVK